MILIFVIKIECQIKNTFKLMNQSYYIAENQEVVLNCTDIDTHLEHDIKFYELGSKIPLENNTNGITVFPEYLIFTNASN